jgi:hypothetical protein
LYFLSTIQHHQMRVRWSCPLESEEAPVEDETRDDDGEEQDEGHSLHAPPRNKHTELAIRTLAAN